MSNLLRNKTILVAGAGGLFGGVIVKEALEQGAEVFATDINVVAMKKRLELLDVNIQSNLLNLQCLDITDESSVRSLFGELDKVLHGAVNATYPRNNNYGQHFFDVTLDSFNENLALHLGSAFLFSQQCAAYFKNVNTDFSLVNISSIYGVIAPKFDVYENTSMTMPVEYAAIKSALLHLNKYVNTYVCDSKFRINSVSPGGIFDNQSTQFLEQYKKYTHGKGMLDVKDSVGAVIFLLSDNARFVTDQNIIVDDGFSIK
jgi:NAD(P)-dependent dehydrogenase (short-subunit alcohol dehydrogenase family)